VIKPIQKKINSDNKLALERKAFNELSVNERIDKLNNLTLSFIKKNFKGSYYLGKYKGKINILFFKDDVKYYIAFLIQETFSKQDLRFYGPVGQVWSTPWVKEYKNIPNEIVYFISLHSIRTSTIDSALWTCRKVGNETTNK
jgi:hypothetical protein